MLLWERLGTQFNNCYVAGRSLDFLPLSLQTCFRSIFFLHFPASGSSTWIECLSSCLMVIQLDAESSQTQQNFICSFSGFFFLSLGRHAWTHDHMLKVCSRATFPVMIDVAPYAFLTKSCYPCQLAADTSHSAIRRTIKIITWRSSEYSANWFDWTTLGLRVLRTRQHSKTTSRKQRDPLNCHDPALRGTQLNNQFSK
jgi:hypothetical protein